MQQNTSSTVKNYLFIWRQLNKFLVQLDVIPDKWEQRTAMFCAYLVEFKKVQSSTLRSYISAIKHVLKCDGYHWNEELVWLGALTRACKKINDKLFIRLPIRFSMLEMILFEVQRLTAAQPYLQLLYLAIFSIAYYGMLRIGEITDSPHAIKACNVELADNKDKIKLTLYTSKTHGRGNIPQEIKISANESTGNRNKFFCPFSAIRNYLNARGRNYKDDNENFFIYRDGSPVNLEATRTFLKECITKLGKNPDAFNFQSFRIGRATDLLRFGFTIEQIKRARCWKSNAVYKYIRPM